MSDDPYRRRCPVCTCLTSKDRFGEGKPNQCFCCDSGYGPPRIRPGARFVYAKDKQGRDIPGTCRVVIEQAVSRRNARAETMVVFEQEDVV